MLSDGEKVCYSPSSGSFLVPHSPRIEEAREKGIKHFGHPHLLTFKEGFDDEVDCNACGLEIGRSGGFSCCKEEYCSFFNLHEFCASLPEEMKDYPQHSQHPLILTHSPYTRHYHSYFSCDVCKITSSTPFCYHCEVCKFDVDLRCASMSIIVCNPIIHKHEMTAQLYHSSFLCCFCGEKHSELGFSYQCRTCSFLIHDQCYPLPKYIKHDSHVHPLQLCHIPEQYFPWLCGVCEETMNKKLGFYVCKRCKYYVHIKCLTKKWDPNIETLEDQINDKLIQFPLPSSEVVRSTLTQFIKNICHSKDDGEYKDGDILNHPSHDHPLILESDLSKFTNFNYSSSSIREYEVCNGCLLPLLNDASFYSCNRSTCNFHLHKWCANLPSELQHPAHTGHTLILQEKMDECFGFFRCKGCRYIGNGFAYKCNECESYYLDVRCAALPKHVRHDSHDKHPLILKYGRSIGGCFSCGRSNFYKEREFFNYSSTISVCPSRFTYGCDACHLSIHQECLILPREIVHWYDEHGFNLTDSTNVFTGDQLADSTRSHVSYRNQSASTYHCEFCEKITYMRGWIYHCIECDQCVDIECVRNLLGLFPYPIKYGGLIYDSRLHQHPLTCISPGKGFVCNRCNDGASFCYTFGIVFECTECKFGIGLKCALIQ